MRNKLLFFLLSAAVSIFTLRAQDQTVSETFEEDSLTIRTNYPMVNYRSPQKYIIRNVEVHGLRFGDPELEKSMSGLRRGDQVTIPGNYVSTAIRNFWNRRYYSNVEIDATIVGDSVDFDIYFTERALVSAWKFQGIRKGQATELTDNLNLRPGTELSDFAINKNVNAVKNFFAEKGFRNADVDVIIENDTILDNYVVVTLDVHKNAKVKIGDIRFFGNEEFSDRRLRKTFKKTHKKNINIFQGAKLKDAEYENDKENMIDFYNSKGYRNANIITDSIYDISPKRIGIDITLEEGNKYYFRNINWVGNSVYSTFDLQRMLGIEPGDTYDKKTMHKRLGIQKEANPEDISVSSLYQNNGYLTSEINPSEIIIGEDSIDLEIKIFEGKQFTINEVNIVGNLRVNDEVIRRELYTWPGELYNRALLMSTMRLLAQMQHFDPENLIPGMDTPSSELVDITWQLEEQASDRAEISGGWGAGMFVGSVGLELNNLSLRNFFKRGQWRPYPQGQSQQLRIRAQSNGSYYKAFSISFTEPWLGGKKPNALTVSTYYSDETNAYYMWQSGTKHFRTLGLSVGLGRRLKWPDHDFTLYNELTYQSYNLKDWDYFLISNGSSNIISLTTAFGRNSVDQPIYPRSGSDFSLSLTVTPPYSLFDGKDYKDPNLSDNDRYKWIEFHKWKLKGQVFYALDNQQKLVLMAKAEMGYLGAYNKNKPSPFEGFDVGGDGMSGYNVYGVDVIGMRGYENSALNPSTITGDYPRAYNKYTMEMRYPFILKPSSTIYGLVFAEGGNAYSNWKKFNPFQIKRSLGAGVRLYLPIVGMLGIDWGYGFDKPAGSNKRSGGQIHYMIGTTF